MQTFLMPSAVATPDNSTITGWQFFRQAFKSGFEFRILPALKPAEQLLHAYSAAWRPPRGCKSRAALAAAAAKLHARLAKVSAAIQAREAALAGKLPQYTLLDPAQLPFYTYT